MDKQSIEHYLKTINLNLDSQTINNSSFFLINQIGFISEIEVEYQAYAALAIISELGALPNVDYKSFSKNGIRIQNVMSHLGKLSKERFLDTLNKQLQKLKKAPQSLKKRVEDIRYSYRFYKKYQTTFQTLFQSLLPNKSCKQEFSAFFWVLYLYIKNINVQTQNISEAKCLMILVFRMIFEECICQADFNGIFPIMEQKIGAIPQISIEKQDFYFQKIKQKMDYFYSQRYSQSHTNFNKLLDNFTYVKRLVDDMSNAYVNQQTTLKYYNQIDELSYLQLKKNLTPQVFRRVMPAAHIQMMCKPLSFDDDDDNTFGGHVSGIIQITPEKRPNLFGQRDCISTPNYELPSSNLGGSPITPNPKWREMSSPLPIMSQLKLFDDGLQSTPISRKIQSQSWMNQKISSVNPEMLKQMQVLFSKLDNKLESIEECEKISTLLRQRILQLIKDFTPKCHNYEERYQKIFSFFVSNFIQIQKNNNNIQSQENEPKQVYITKGRIIGIATVSCEIFNYIHNAISYEFKHHCQVFGTDIKVAVEAFQLFQLYISDKMSLDLKNYFDNARKRFLVSDIWQNQQGFKLLFQSQTNTDLLPIRSTIIYQTESRIKQICRQSGIESKIISKTMNIMNFIFQNKPYLLKNNNIDQIILCCLMSCLSINEKQGDQTLEILFCQYNSNIQFSFNSNQLGLRDTLGNQMKIVDFYNEVFLEEIQDMLKENLDQLDQFLLTPVRINKQYSLSTLNHSFNKIKQKPLTGGFLFNAERGTDRRQKLRRKIIQQNLDMQKEDDKQKEGNEQDPPSPTFGLSRHYSFSKF